MYKCLDAGFHQKKISRIPESGFPYLAKRKTKSHPTCDKRWTKNHPTTVIVHDLCRRAIVSEEPVIRPALCVPYRCVDKRRWILLLEEVWCFFLLARALLHFIQTLQLQQSSQTLKLRNPRWLSHFYFYLQLHLRFSVVVYILF